MPIDLPPALTKKIGPLPVWAWGAVVLGLIGVYLYSRSRPDDTSAVAFTPPDEGMLTSETDSSFEGLTGGGVGNIGNGTGGGGGVGGSGGIGGEGTWYPAPPVYENPYQPIDYNPEPVSSPTVITAPPVTVAPAKQTSFVWGGITYRRGDLVKFRAALKKTGVTYAKWASNHPKAAMDVFGTMV